MKKLLAGIVVVGLLGAAVYVYLRFFRAPYPETLFPESTTGYAFLSDVQLARRQWNQTLLGKEIRNSPRGKIFDRQWERLTSLLETAAGVDLRPLFHQFTRDVALGIYPLPSGKVSGAFTAYVKDVEDAVKIIEQKMDPDLKRRIPDLQKQTVAYEGTSYYRYKSSYFPADLTPSYYLDSHHLVLSTSEEGIKILLDGKRKKQNLLMHSSLFQNTKKEIGFRHGLLFYLNVQGILGTVTTSLPPAVEKLWPSINRVLGLEALESLVYSVSIKKDGFVEEGFLSVSPKRQGLIRVYLEQKPQKLDSIYAVPPDSKVLSASTVADLGKMWDEVNSQLSSVLSADQYDKWQKVLNAMRGIFNFDIRRDLLEPVGSEFSFSYEPSPDLVANPTRLKYLLILHLRKPDKFRETVERLVSLAAFRGLQQKRENYKGKNVQILEARIGDLSLSPAYYMENSWAYLSTEYNLLKKAIDAQSGKKSIETLPDFRKVTEGFPAEVNGLSYTNVQSYLQMYAAIMQRQSQDEESRWIREYGIQEEFASLGKNLYGSASYTNIDESGVRVHTYTSVPTALLSLPAIVSTLPKFLREYRERSAN